MLKKLEQLCGHLESIDGSMETIARAVQLISESHLSKNTSEQPSSLVQPEPTSAQDCSTEPKLFLRDVLNFLNISRRTYFRKVAKGQLLPRHWEGPDYFYRSDLEAEKTESKRRGRL